MSEYDYLFKVIVVGDGAVGKTAITIRFAEGRFEEHYKMTIGVDFAIKLIEIGGYKVKLQVWDTGGQERFSYIRPLYYKGAMAAIAIFDLTNRESYENLPKWFQEVADNCGAIPLMLVGNKSDLPDRAVETTEAQELSNKLGVEYFEASAKNGQNINDLFRRLGEILLASKIPAFAAAQASSVTEEVTPSVPTPPEISAPSTIPTFSPPPTVPTISAPPKPPTFTPPTIPAIKTPTIETPTVPTTPAPSAEASPSLDEALKILEGTEPAQPVETPPAPEPFEIKPPVVEPIDLTPTPPTEVKPPTLEPLDLTPPTPEPIDVAPPAPKPVEFKPIAKPIDLTPPAPEPPLIDAEPPTPITTPVSMPETPTEFIPFSTSSSVSASTETSQTESRPIFVPFSASSSSTTTTHAATSSGSTGATWIDFMKSAPKHEEPKKATFIPFVTSTVEEPEEIVLEVVSKEKVEEPETKEVVCPGCGRKISSAWKFCTYCGSKLD
ncbi:MAG: GTP-binding protein [Candidatus Helarchaeota archaeon]